MRLCKYILCSKFDFSIYLRAPDQKYRESDDRNEISYFILFHQKYPFGKLFSKIIINSPSAFWFFPKIRKVQNTARSSLAPPPETELLAALVTLICRLKKQKLQTTSNYALRIEISINVRHEMS